jgi:peptidyl-prolyl cis-trans isomerase C
MKINDANVDPADWPSPQLAAVHELLRQRALALDYLAAGADAQTVQDAIDRVLAEEVTVPEPTDAECRRFHEAHADKYRSGDLVLARHILLQITSGAPVAAIRAFGEAMLKEIRRNPEVFGDRARKNSNCPSGANGGNLGQLQRGETVPEFDKALFETTTVGVLPMLVKTRYGFHIVAVDKRIEGVQLPYDIVHDKVRKALHGRSEQRALSQYVRILAANADIEGVALQAATSPLVQ